MLFTFVALPFLWIDSTECGEALVGYTDRSLNTGLGMIDEEDDGGRGVVIWMVFMRHGLGGQ